MIWTINIFKKNSTVNDEAKEMITDNFVFENV